MNERQKDQKQWKDEALAELEAECRRLLVKIDLAKKETSEPQSYKWASVKRCSLELNMIGSKIRAGYFQSLRF